MAPPTRRPRAVGRVGRVGRAARAARNPATAVRRPAALVAPARVSSRARCASKRGLCRMRACWRVLRGCVGGDPCVAEPWQRVFVVPPVHAVSTVAIMLACVPPLLANARTSRGHEHLCAVPTLLSPSQLLTACGARASTRTRRRLRRASPSVACRSGMPPQPPQRRSRRPSWPPVPAAVPTARPARLCGRHRRPPSPPRPAPAPPLAARQRRARSKRPAPCLAVTAGRRQHQAPTAPPAVPTPRPACRSRAPPRRRAALAWPRLAGRRPAAAVPR